MAAKKALDGVGSMAVMLGMESAFSALTSRLSPYRFEQDSIDTVSQVNKAAGVWSDGTSITGLSCILAFLAHHLKRYA